MKHHGLSFYPFQLHHYILYHENEYPYICPIDGAATRPEDMMDHAANVHGMKQCQTFWKRYSFTKNDNELKVS